MSEEGVHRPHVAGIAGTSTNKVGRKNSRLFYNPCTFWYIFGSLSAIVQVRKSVISFWICNAAGSFFLRSQDLRWFSQQVITCLHIFPWLKFFNWIYWVQPLLIFTLRLSEGYEQAWLPEHRAEWRLRRGRRLWRLIPLHWLDCNFAVNSTGSWTRRKKSFSINLYKHKFTDKVDNQNQH